MNLLCRHPSLEDLLLDVLAPDKAGLFHRNMAQVHGLPQDAVVAALLRREAIGSTTLGQGVTIPHARVDGLHHAGGDQGSARSMAFMTRRATVAMLSSNGRITHGI